MKVEFPLRLRAVPVASGASRLRASSYLVRRQPRTSALFALLGPLNQAKKTFRVRSSIKSFAAFRLSAGKSESSAAR